jgi:hypothetical protein
MIPLSRVFAVLGILGVVVFAPPPLQQSWETEELYNNWLPMLKETTELAKQNENELLELRSRVELIEEEATTLNEVVMDLEEVCLVRPVVPGGRHRGTGRLAQGRQTRIWAEGPIWVHAPPKRRR